MDGDATIDEETTSSRVLSVRRLGDEAVEWRSASGLTSFTTEGLIAQLAVLNERLAQREEFGDAADDLLTPPEWIARLAKHLGRAVTQDPAVFRRELVIVGALALAGIESFDRTQTP